MRAMSNNTQPKYIVGKPDSERVPLGYVTTELRYRAAHVATVSNLGSMKTWKQKEPACLMVGSVASFLLTSGGMPIARSNGSQVRRMTEVDAADLEAFNERIRKLEDERARFLAGAWRRGEIVHVSEAVNYPKQTAAA